MGQLSSTLKCTECGYESIVYDPFWDLSLPLPTGTKECSLTRCFELFMKEELLDGDEKPVSDRAIHIFGLIEIVFCPSLKTKF